MAKDLQELTEEIARKGGLQTDLKQFADPIYVTQMEGNFFRTVYHSSNRPLVKIILSIFVFILPIVPLGVIGFTSFNNNRFDVTIIIFLVLLGSIYFIVGLKLLFSGVKDLVNSRRK